MRASLESKSAEGLRQAPVDKGAGAVLRASSDGKKGTSPAQLEADLLLARSDLTATTKVMVGWCIPCEAYTGVQCEASKS